MKKLFSTIALALLTTAASAHAAPQPAWVCGLNFEGRAQGVKFIVGIFETAAQGSLRCVAPNGETYDRSVTITMGQSLVSPSIGIGSYEFAGAAANISLFTLSPDALLGNYLVEDGRVALVGGVGAFVAEKLNPPQVALQVSMQLLHGVGFDVGVHRMTISAN